MIITLPFILLPSSKSPSSTAPVVDAPSRAADVAALAEGVPQNSVASVVEASDSSGARSPFATGRLFKFDASVQFMSSVQTGRVPPPKEPSLSAHAALLGSNQAALRSATTCLHLQASIVFPLPGA